MLSVWFCRKLIMVRPLSAVLGRALRGGAHHRRVRPDAVTTPPPGGPGARHTVSHSQTTLRVTSVETAGAPEPPGVGQATGMRPSTVFRRQAESN